MNLSYSPAERVAKPSAGEFSLLVAADCRQQSIFIASTTL
jgi:hypothetical protein